MYYQKVSKMPEILKSEKEPLSTLSTFTQSTPISKTRRCWKHIKMLIWRTVNNINKMAKKNHQRKGVKMKRIH